MNKIDLPLRNTKVAEAPAQDAFAEQSALRLRALNSRVQQALSGAEMNAEIFRQRVAMSKQQEQDVPIGSYAGQPLSQPGR